MLLGVGTGLGDRLQTREIGLPGQEQLTVRQAQQGRRVGGVTGLLRGPEGPRLGQLTLPLLGERLRDRGAYLVGAGRAGGRNLRTAPRLAPGQLGVQCRDLSAQHQNAAQDGDAHGAGGGRGDQQGDRHGAH